MASLKAICKRRIMEEMLHRTTAQSGGYVAMVVDSSTLRILSSCSKVYDVLEEGVTVVEQITRQRQPLSGLDVIYFLTPEPKVVELLLKDFQDVANPQYRNVHLFFSGPLGPSSQLIREIAACAPLIPRIKTFVEFNLSFIACEQRVFHLDNPWSFIDFFPLQRYEVVNEMADQLLCVCATLAIEPSVRFQKSASGLCERLATRLHSKLPKLNLQRQSTTNATFIILDRSIDLPVLFLHEYTYQALAYDLLDIPVCRPPTRHNVSRQAEEETELENVYKHEIVNNLKKKETQKVGQSSPPPHVSSLVFFVPPPGHTLEEASSRLHSRPGDGQATAALFLSFTLGHLWSSLVFFSFLSFSLAFFSFL
eukprot:GHVT01041640.1.p1 GENE.GHVT01041640.1~~GHVT01041640.1.p1  ORF type:complete len:366 (-),score=70.72 GHVT01041640.1:35-1132(-)